MNKNNEKIWLLNEWFWGWNKSKTAFAIKSPWNEKALIWIYKRYYLSSNYTGWFGIEINIKHYKTGKEHFYQEVTYELNTKKIREINGETLANYFIELNKNNSQKYRDLVTELNGKNIYD